MPEPLSRDDLAELERLVHEVGNVHRRYGNCEVGDTLAYATYRQENDKAKLALANHVLDQWGPILTALRSEADAESIARTIDHQPFREGDVGGLRANQRARLMRIARRLKEDFLIVPRAALAKRGQDQGGQEQEDGRLGAEYVEVYEPLDYVRPVGTDIQTMRESVWKTELYKRGDTVLVWVNEGDLPFAFVQQLRKRSEPSPTPQSDTQGSPDEERAVELLRRFVAARQRRSGETVHSTQFEGEGWSICELNAVLSDTRTFLTSLGEGK